ncbi:MAG: response regulator [Gammaproteobacteria bacterium]|nr:response regulator [Gammaproteobacteria bacterium]
MKVAKRKLIVVDDDQAMANFVYEVGDALGFDVRTTFDGVQFLELLGEEPANVVVIDVVMPVMDGIEILQKLAKFKVQPSIILMSGYNHMTVTKKLGLSLGLSIIGDLHKPFRISELTELLDQIPPAE